MTDTDHFTLITGGSIAELHQRQARTDFAYRVRAWSAGAFHLDTGTADKWWPLTRESR